MLSQRPEGELNWWTGAGSIGLRQKYFVTKAREKSIGSGQVSLVLLLVNGYGYHLNYSWMHGNGIVHGES